MEWVPVAASAENRKQSLPDYSLFVVIEKYL